MIELFDRTAHSAASLIFVSSRVVQDLPGLLVVIKAVFSPRPLGDVSSWRKDVFRSIGEWSQLMSDLPQWSAGGWSGSMRVFTWSDGGMTQFNVGIPAVHSVMVHSDAEIWRGSLGNGPD